MGYYVVTDDVRMIDCALHDSQVLLVMHCIENKTRESLKLHLKSDQDKCVDSENSHDLIGEINVESATQTHWLLEAEPEQSRQFSRSDCSILCCVFRKRCSRLF